MKFHCRVLVLALVSVFLTMPQIAHAWDLKIAIMQDKMGSAKKYSSLKDYLGGKGIHVSFVATRNYTHASKMFSKGEADAMFSGSGVAATMIIKELATPLVRPVSKDGTSTYWAVVLAPIGSPRFTQDPAYFKDKRVVYCSLASSGEIYFRSLKGQNANDVVMKKASSHASAIKALSKGMADVAIVKNRVWDKEKKNYPNLVRIGEDPGGNPDGTLIVSKSLSRRHVAQLKDAMLSIGSSSSTEAKAVRLDQEIKGFTETTMDDFKLTLKLIEKAGITKDFNFSF